MRRLEALGEADNTQAFFTSDNGYFWGEHGLNSKGLPYTESVKVPFMVRWPGRIPASAVSQRLVAGIDLLPTVLEAARIAPRTLGYPLDGRSLLAPGRRRRLLLEFHSGHRRHPSWASLRTRRWQYLEYYENDDTTVSFREYYDLVADPYQLENLLGARGGSQGTSGRQPAEIGRADDEREGRVSPDPPSLGADPSGPSLGPYPSSEPDDSPSFVSFAESSLASFFFSSSLGRTSTQATPGTSMGTVQSSLGQGTASGFFCSSPSSPFFSFGSGELLRAGSTVFPVSAVVAWLLGTQPTVEISIASNRAILRAIIFLSEGRPMECHGFSGYAFLGVSR